MKQTNKKSAAKTSISKKAISASPLRRGVNRIAGVEKTTVISLAGVAAAGAAGYLLWRNREKIMSTVSKLGDSIVQPISHFFGSNSSEVQDLDSMNPTPSTWTPSNRDSSFRDLDNDSKAL